MTAYLKNGGKLETAQHMGHEGPRTTGQINPRGPRAIRRANFPFWHVARRRSHSQSTQRQYATGCRETLLHPPPVVFPNRNHQSHDDAGDRRKPEVLLCVGLPPFGQGLTSRYKARGRFGPLSPPGKDCVRLIARQTGHVMWPSRRNRSGSSSTFMRLSSSSSRGEHVRWASEKSSIAPRRQGLTWNDADRIEYDLIMLPKLLEKPVGLLLAVGFRGDLQDLID
jgi:hypothetical protein